MGSELIVPPKPLLGIIGGPNAGGVLSTARIKQTFNQQLTTGDVTLYTVPAGKRANLNLYAYNSSAGTINAILKIIKNGVTIRLGAAAAITTNTTSALAVIYNTYPILEAGDSFVINTDASGLNIFGYLLEFSANEDLKSAYIASDGTHTSYTVYTCPAGKKAYILNVMGSNGPFRFYNGTVATRTYNANVVPSGGSSGSTNKALPQFTVTTNNSSSQASCAWGLSAGDSIVITTDSAALAQLFAIQNILEVSA